MIFFDFAKIRWSSPKLFRIKIIHCAPLKLEVVAHNTKVFVKKQVNEYRKRYNFSQVKQ